MTDPTYPRPSAHSDASSPANPLKRAFDTWLAEAGTDPRRQAPADELTAEHHVMTAVLVAMEAELQHMQGGRPLRPQFWADVIDFNGNFVHFCHRVKEEDHLVPALIEAGLFEERQLGGLHAEHVRAKDLTLGIRDGVEEGDWEKVLRLVVLYVHFLRGHMRQEEDGIFRTAREELPAEVNAQLRADFDRVDEAALGERGRMDFVELARRLMSSTGVDYDLSPPAA